MRNVFLNAKIFPSAHYMIYDIRNHTKIYNPYWKVDERLFYDKWIKRKRSHKNI